MSTYLHVRATTSFRDSLIRSTWQTAVAVTFAGILLLLAISEVAAFQRPGKSPFKKGDKVEVEFHFDWYPGEITAVEPTGWLKAKFKDKDGRDQEWTLPPNKFRKPMNAKPAGKAGAKGENPFDNGEASKPRTWTDATGKFKVEATFTELKDDTVHLKKADGSPLKVPLEKLSEADQKIAQQFAGGDGNSDSPFQADDEMSAGDGKKVVEADWSSVEAVPFDDVRAAVPSDAVKLSAEIKPRRVMLQARPNTRNDAIFESVRRIGFHAESASAIVTHVFAPPGGTAVSRVERCDLNTGKSLGSVELKTAAVPYDVSPDGKLLLCVNEWPGKEKNIEVWGINGKELENVISFLPTDVASFHKDNLNTNDAGYIDNEHIWTLDSMGKLVVWQLRKAKAIYAVTLPLNTRPAFSPGRNYFAVSLPTGVFVLESATGKTITKLDGSIGIVGTANFSDDGKRLAVVSPALVKVFNLETGKAEHEVFFPRRLAGNAVNFLSDDFVLVDGAFVVDLPKRLVIWEYQLQADQHFAKRMICGFQGLIWAAISAPDRSSKGLFGLALPTDDVKKASESVAANEAPVVKPGTQFDLRVQCQNPQDAQKISAILPARLQEAGLSVTPGAPLILEASVVPGKSRTVTYQTIGAGRGTESVQVTEQHCRLAIVEGGKVQWESTVTVENSPFLINGKRDQTLQDTVSKASESAVEGFFKGTVFPTYLMRHPEFVVRGATSIGTQGSAPVKSSFQQKAEQPQGPQPPGRGGVPPQPGFGAPPG